MLLQSIVTQGWRRIVQAAMGLGMAATLVACGGGGGSAGTSVFPGGSGGGATTPTAADLSVQLTKATLSTSGTDTLTVTVTAVDANRNVVGKVPVTFAVDNNAVITPGGTATDEKTGVVTATVQTGADVSKRTIKVTVTAGSVTRSASIDVVDSVTGGKVSDIVVVSDSSTIPNDGTASAKITVTTLDANRSAIGGSPVTLRVDNSNNAAEDAFVSTGGATTTNANTGQLQGTLTLGTNKANRSISIIATSGSITRAIVVNVVPPAVTKPKAADITLVLDKLNISNAIGEVVTATVTAVNADRNTIAGIPVSIKVDNNATVAVSDTQTDKNGVVTATVGIGADKSNRLITVTATSDSLVRTATFQVRGTNILGTASPASPDAGSTGNRIEYRVVDVNQGAMPGIPITVTAPGVVTGVGTTDANGAYIFNYTAPNTPGALDFTATAAGKTTVINLVVKGGASTTPNAVGPVVSAAITASPSVVRVNSATDKSNRTELRALFLAANNAPVKNVRARFDLNGDANSIGGTIGAGDSLVYSDVNGVAVTNYTPGERASPTDGVTIRVCWDYADFAVGVCPNQKLTTLTVVSDPVSISIGTDNTLGEGSSKLTYVKRYVVLVVDAAGNPKSDVQLSASIDLTNYVKGYYLFDAVAKKWVDGYQQEPGNVDTTLSSSITDPSTKFRLGDTYGRLTCANEDTNRNGSIDGGEDINGNGQLDPRKSDVSIALNGSTKTDTSGTAVIQIEYPKSLGSWVKFRLSVSAAGVVSPPAYYPAPGSDAYLPVLSEALTTESPPPPFQFSPYGQRIFANGAYCTTPK
ncbi:MAG: hypothetical protein EKK53_28750 [Burkholderiales bacterium]|nr:MAG: hypothetical protein EKK53_28750 [Burkholderiales bacterium]